MCCAILCPVPSIDFLKLKNHVFVVEAEDCEITPIFLSIDVGCKFLNEFTMASASGITVVKVVCKAV